jgi:hypothetical protein
MMQNYNASYSEVKAGGSQVQDQTKQKQNANKRAVDMSQVVEHLHCIFEAISSILSMTKNNNNNTRLLVLAINETSYSSAIPYSLLQIW